MSPSRWVHVPLLWPTAHLANIDKQNDLLQWYTQSVHSVTMWLVERKSCTRAMTGQYMQMISRNTCLKWQ